jgi:type I restriction enzyme S subunit
MARIRADESIHRGYLAHALKHLEPRLKSQTSGTGIPHVDREVLEGFQVFRPVATEQAGIAHVLDTLDTTIRQTEAIIEKLKQVKQGLLHDLLTRGIDANGELRPPQNQALHLYKDSPLGWIPKEWEVCGVLDVAPTDRQCILTGPFGAQLGQADFVSEGVPVLRIGNVQAGFIDWSDVQFVSHVKASRLERFSVLPGDLLFARQGATTGRNALADERADGALINYHIIRVAVDRKRCEPIYLHALFNSDESKGQVDQEKGRGTREGINSKQIAALRFALPQIEEQRMLVARMTALNKAMDQESMFVAKLRLQKAGLMDDLLTGRVRVRALLQSPHDASAA